MPLKIVPPRAGKTPYYYVRGTHLGVSLDRSTKSTERATAAKFLKLWKDEIEQGRFARAKEPTFLDAAVSYMADTGNDRFVQPVVEHFGKQVLRSITQQDVNDAAIRLYPAASPATRNRQVHTVVSAILKHAGVEWKIRRPKGWRGSKRTDWLKPEQAFRLFKAARATDIEFEIFLIFLCYTGLRLSEALSLSCDRLEIAESFAYMPTTKNDDPRGVYLPPVVVAALASHPRGVARFRKDGRGERVFRFTKCGRLYTLMAKVKKAAGADLHFVTFHVMRHTWATWMRRYGGLDTTGLLATGAWLDEESVRRYEHVIVDEESRKAKLLPVDNSWKQRVRTGLSRNVKVR